MVGAFIRSLPAPHDPEKWHPVFGSRSCVKKEAKRRQTRILPFRIKRMRPRPDLFSFPRLRGEGREGALACRRSTAALAAANQRRRSASERASGDAASFRHYLKADLSQSSDKVADRSSCRPGVFPKPPGSGGDEPPPAGTALAPSAGVTGCRPVRGRDSVPNVAETGTNVKVESLKRGLVIKALIIRLVERCSLNVRSAH